MSNPSDFPPGPPFPGSQPSPPPIPSRPVIVGDGLPEKPQSEWRKMFGPLIAVGVLILKFFAKLKFFILPALKFLPVILKSGGTMFLMIGIYAALYGWKWAVGFVVLLLIHECGHLIVAKSFGLKVSAPMFIPFMGAFIALKEAPRDAWMESCVGIGGPILGSLGALGCHALGLHLDSPLLISLGYTAYFLNLFNLTPLGQLDGGRIATALSPWLWLPGLAIMIWFGWQYKSPIILLVLIMSVPRLLSLFRKRTPEEERFYEVTAFQRARMASMYFGLIGLLMLGMRHAQDNLQERREFRSHQQSTTVARVETGNY